MHVCILEFFFKLGNFALLLGHDDQLRINILCRDVRNLRGLACVVQRAEVLFKVLIRRGEASDHEGVRVATETLLEQAGQFRLTIRHDVSSTLLATRLTFSQRRDDLAQHVKTLVNINALFGLLASRPGQTLLLRTRQIH